MTTKATKAISPPSVPSMSCVLTQQLDNLSLQNNRMKTVTPFSEILSLSPLVCPTTLSLSPPLIPLRGVHQQPLSPTFIPSSPVCSVTYENAPLSPSSFSSGTSSSCSSFVCINKRPECSAERKGKEGECVKCYMRRYMREYKKLQRAAAKEGKKFVKRPSFYPDRRTTRHHKTKTSAKPKRKTTLPPLTSEPLFQETKTNEIVVEHKQEEMSDDNISSSSSCSFSLESPTAGGPTAALLCNSQPPNKTTKSFSLFDELLREACFLYDKEVIKSSRISIESLLN